MRAFFNTIDPKRTFDVVRGTRSCNLGRDSAEQAASQAYLEAVLPEAVFDAVCISHGK